MTSASFASCFMLLAVWGGTFREGCLWLEMSGF